MLRRSRCHASAVNGPRRIFTGPEHPYFNDVAAMPGAGVGIPNSLGVEAFGSDGHALFDSISAGEFHLFTNGAALAMRLSDPLHLDVAEFGQNRLAPAEQ